jgi:hypothetical protein
VIALAYTTTIQDRRSGALQAIVLGRGLSRSDARRFQSGEMDRAGQISRCGDAMLKTYLCEAANGMLRHSTRPSQLSIWGRALSERIGQENRSSLSRASSPWCSTGCSVTEWSSASNTLRHDDQHAKERNPPLTAAECCPCRDEGRRPRRSFCSRIGRLRSGRAGAELLTRCCGQPRDREENVDPARPSHDHAVRRQNSYPALGPMLSGQPDGLRPDSRATAKGGCGLDLRRADQTFGSQAFA